MPVFVCLFVCWSFFKFVGFLFLKFSSVVLSCSFWNFCFSFLFLFVGFTMFCALRDLWPPVLQYSLLVVVVTYMQAIGR